MAEDERGCSPIQVGVGKDIGWRKRDLQTSNPLELKLLGWIASADDFETEPNLYRRLAPRRGRGEWFDIEPANVLTFLMEVGKRGFVAKNADAFEITGYDRDAVPKYLGVCESADLAIDECCPFCECLCGSIFRRPHRCTTASSATRSPTARNCPWMVATGQKSEGLKTNNEQG